MSSPYGQHFKRLKEQKGNVPKPKASPSSQRARRPLPGKRRSKRVGSGASRVWGGVFLVGFLGCLGLILWEEEVESFAKRVQVKGFTQAIGQEKKAPAKEQGGENLSQARQVEEELTPEEIKNWSASELSFLKDLTQRKKVLDERERGLVQLEADLQRRKEEVEARIRELEQTRHEISKMLGDRVDEDEERIAKLVETYSGMKPQNAAQVISGLNDGLAISILTRMNKRSASDVMNFMDPARARELSEKFAGYRN